MALNRIFTMDEETPVKTPGVFLPIAFGLLGSVLGAVAIYLSVSGSGAMKDDLTQKLAETTAKIEKYEQRFAELEERGRLAAESANTMSMKTRSLEEGINQLAKQTQNVVNQLVAQISALKTAASAPQAVAEKTDRPANADDAKADAAAPAPEAAAAQGDVYVVKSGDTFTKIARALGVSISDIEKANPNVDSSRLKIGQKLAVPAKTK